MQAPPVTSQLPQVPLLVQYSPEQHSPSWVQGAFAFKQAGTSQTASPLHTPLQQSKSIAQMELTG